MKIYMNEYEYYCQICFYHAQNLHSAVRARPYLTLTLIEAV